MIRLSREIRFALVPHNQISDRATANSWSGWPATNLIAPQLVLRCVVSGEPDPITGYLCNIKDIDGLLRVVVTQTMIPDFSASQTAESLIQNAFSEVNRLWDQQNWHSPTRLEKLTLAVSPYLNFLMSTEQPTMVQLTQQFEFSAAHRLHSDSLSDQENREFFGKCNNPEGHGHNYVVEVTVARERPADARPTDAVISLYELESIVKSQVIDRLDHKHLNRDVEYFTDINPTVENITIAVYNWLDGQLGDTRLSKVKVYETPKTWAEYSGN